MCDGDQLAIATPKICDRRYQRSSLFYGLHEELHCFTFSPEYAAVLTAEPSTGLYHCRVERSSESVNGDLATAAGAAAGLGGAATAAAVSACCAGPALGPLVVSALGASGAVALEENVAPYAIPLLLVSGGAIAVSIWLNRRQTRCAPGPRPMFLHRFSRVLLWASAIVWVAAAASVAWARLA